jgi:DNA-binding PadR family transcriptional regulator
MIELLILYVVAEKEMTMYGISKQISAYFSAFSNPSFGAIKPALNRLENANFIRSRKTISEGGRLSCFYSIGHEGKEKLKSLLLEHISSNPLQFHSIFGIKIFCSSVLEKNERANLFFQLKYKAQEHKFAAEKALKNNQKKLDFYQKIILDNTILEYKNLIVFIENLEKDNERNS